MQTAKNTNFYFLKTPFVLNNTNFVLIIQLYYYKVGLIHLGQKIASQPLNIQMAKNTRMRRI
jgi:hypothetical protein